MLDIYGTLEIKNVLEKVSEFSKSELAKQQILNLKMLSNADSIRHSLKNLDEMMSLILRHSNLPINVSFDIEKYIALSKKEGVLTPLDLDRIASDILNAKRINDYFKKAKSSLYPNLIDIASKLFDITSLEVKIHKIIAPNLSIYDNASPELLSIRRQISKLENEVRVSSLSLVNKYREYLSEENISLRNDHFVLPVSSSYKNKVPGIIHDISSSGQTTFIEPNELVNLSNKIYILKSEEKDEINRLLRLLSNEVAVHGDEILNNNKIIAELDFIESKAMFANQNKSFVATLVDEQIIDIKGARHPLIKDSDIIANDFYLDNSQRIIIISGPNAGGKTVALKTLGLMVMMNQMGLALPTKISAILGYFPRIYADIGDNQSLSDNLSTFAAHVSNLSTITHFVTSHDLVLLDELGTGTSPNEGESLALAICDFLLRKKVFAVISSHFETLKQYAYEKDNIVNAMMVFDEHSLLPTYVLKIGYPGRSYGLEMAKRYHLDDEVIKNAKVYLTKNQKTNINDVLDKLNKVLLENDNLNKSIKEKNRLIESKQKDLEHKEQELNYKKEHLLEDVNNKKLEMIENARKQIDDLLKVLNKPNIKPHELIEAKSKLKLLAEEEVLDEEIDNTIKVNDYVKISSLDLIGKVSKLNGNKIEIITPDGMSVKSSLDKVEKTDEPIQRIVKSSNIDEMVKIKSDVKLELNVIGKHVDEGIEEVSKYLDDARIRHFKEVRIIHGMGTGALRKAIHEYLSKQSFVEEYHYGGTFDGGTGATIVKLK